MKHPPYHLRHNKAVDRFLLVEALRIMGEEFHLSDYVYIGLGGPFLEDCRLISEYFPEIAIESLEEDAETFKRQQFHRFSSRIILLNSKLSDFIKTYTPDQKVIFWLDYTDLKMQNFDDFMNLLTRVPDYSIVKLTLRSQLENGNPFQLTLDSTSNPELIAKQKKSFRDNFELQYGAILPASIDDSAFQRSAKFVELIQQMIRLAAAKALPSESNRSFCLVNSAYYSDSTNMFSATGIITPREDEKRIESLFKTWPYSCIKREEPFHIDLPILSVKERLTLERYLPLGKTTGSKLLNVLKYQIDKNNKTSLRKMQQYDSFHKYYPYFAKVVV